MPNKTGQKKVVNNTSIKAPSKPKKGKSIVKTQTDLKPHDGQILAINDVIIPEEKVEVLIKEIIRINPRDFSAFKHALEMFVSDWDK